MLIELITMTKGKNGERVIKWLQKMLEDNVDSKCKEECADDEISRGKVMMMMSAYHV